MTAQVPKVLGPINLGEYLFARLFQIGIRRIHGIPGDYNLQLLDYVTPAGLMWVGNCNELNAGYAADGYSRIKGISAVVTKCGVGELSILNAIAGACSEYVPVIHIVGTPSTKAQRNDKAWEHTLSNGDHKIFETIARQVTCATAILDGSSDPAAMVDEAVAQCLLQSRPVYIALPIDMVQEKVEGRRLQTHIDVHHHPTDRRMEDQVVDIITTHLQAAKEVAILIDAGANRRKAFEEVDGFVRRSRIPTFVTPMGKGAVDESLSNFKGVYGGKSSEPSIESYFDSVDLLLHIGSIKSDSTTGWFAIKPAPRATIVEFPIDNRGIKVNDSYITNIRLDVILHKIAERIETSMRNSQAQPILDGSTSKIRVDNSNSEIEHNWLWPRLSAWLQDGDVVITETGTANYGIRETTFPSKVRAICQPLWSSIGYATAACQGAALAAREVGDARTILFTGEGSFQLTGQELSTMIRHDLTPIIFVICNGGYTTERFIHGMDAPYNDVQTWKYTDLCGVYGGERNAESFEVTTKSQLEQLLCDPNFSAGRSLKFVSIYMRREDAPGALMRTVSALSERG